MEVLVHLNLQVYRRSSPEGILWYEKLSASEREKKKNLRESSEWDWEGMMGLEDPNSNPQNESAAKYGTNFTFYVLQKYMFDSPPINRDGTNKASS